MKIFINALGLIVLLTPCGAFPDIVRFDRKTDSIGVIGQTSLGSQVTFEARVLFTEQYGGAGLIFNEWIFIFEDQQFGVGPSGAQDASGRQNLWGHLHPISIGGEFHATTGLPRNAWHHIAYVYDGAAAQERLYINGQLVNERQANSGDVADRNCDKIVDGECVSGEAGRVFLGSIQRDGGRRDGFIGYLDYLRVSNESLYSGQSFMPPVGDLPLLPTTTLLFNFNEPAGAITVHDEARGLLGAFGNGVIAGSGSTSPEIIKLPSLRIESDPAGSRLLWGASQFETRLQVAEIPQGPFIEIPSATSPFTADSGSGSQRFYRLQLVMP